MNCVKIIVSQNYGIEQTDMLYIKIELLQNFLVKEYLKIQMLR